MQVINKATYEGHENRAISSSMGLRIEYWYKDELKEDGVEYTPKEAVQLARDILRYYGEGE